MHLHGSTCKPSFFYRRHLLLFNLPIMHLGLEANEQHLQGLNFNKWSWCMMSPVALAFSLKVCNGLTQQHPSHYDWSHTSASIIIIQSLAIPSDNCEDQGWCKRSKPEMLASFWIVCIASNLWEAGSAAARALSRLASITSEPRLKALSCSWFARRSKRNCPNPVSDSLPWAKARLKVCISICTGKCCFCQKRPSHCLYSMPLIEDLVWSKK